MRLPEHLFLYGTLLQRACNPVAVALHEHLGLGRVGQVPGQLHAVCDPAGWYPALLPGAGIVAGMVHDVGPGFDAGLLAMLDAYEDVRPDASGEYRRETWSVRTQIGEVSADLYVYNVPLPPGSRPVTGGDFQAFLVRHGLPRFG